MTFASPSSSSSSQLSLKTQVLFVGEKAHLLCSYEEPITECKFVIPGIAYEIELSLQSPPFITNSGYKFSYYGKGLSSGDCGVTIHNLTFINQGNATCILSPQSDDNKDDKKILENVEIRINHPQGRLPLLPKITILNNDNSLKVGQTLAAECIAEDEFANLSWHLNNEILTNTTQQTLKLRKSDDSVTTSVEENYFYKIKSILMHELRDGDNGTILKCRLDSFLTNKTSETDTKIQLILQNETRTLSLPKIGGAYDIAINFFAFPRPLSQKWKVNERNIYYGKITNEFISRELKYLGSNQWRAVLHITNVTERNFHLNYTLLVNDANGKKSYNIRLDDLANHQHYHEILNFNNSIIDGGVDAKSTTVKLIGLDGERKLIFSNTQATKALLNLKSSMYRRRSSLTKMPPSSAESAETSEIIRYNGSNRTKIIRKSRYNTTAIMKITITTAIPTKTTIENDDVINLKKTGIIATIKSDKNNDDDAAPSFKIDSNDSILIKNDGRVHFSLEKVLSFMIAFGFIGMTILLLIFLSMICHYRRQVVILKTEIIQMNLGSNYNQSCLYPPIYNNYSSSIVSFQRNPLISADAYNDVKTSIVVDEENFEASNSHLYQCIDHVYDEIISTKNCENNEDEEKPNNYENNESMSKRC